MRNIFFCYIFLFCCACGGSDSDSINKIKFNEDLSTDFMKFYMQFHTDSAYQMEHILFPMDGLPPNADSTTIANNNFKWTREEWSMHHPFSNPDNVFNQEYVTMDDKTVIEYIIDNTSGFGMERRFSKLSNEWYLIYYSGMNSLIEGDLHKGE